MIKKFLIFVILILSFVSFFSYARDPIQDLIDEANQSSSAEDSLIPPAEMSSVNWWENPWSAWSSSQKCDWVKLNLDFPWIGRCIKTDKVTDKFWSLMGAVMKLLVNLTIAAGFLALVAAGVMVAMGGMSGNIGSKWKELLIKVIIWIVLLWTSGIILHTINPNFFKVGG